MPDTPMNNFELIRVVKKHPALYDRSLKDWNNMTIKRQLWKQVSATVFRDQWSGWDKRRKNTALAEAQKRWKNLRSCFYREMRIQQNGTKNRACRRKYLYFEDMQFLLDYEGKYYNQNRMNDDDTMNDDDMVNHDDTSNQDDSNQDDSLYGKVNHDDDDSLDKPQELTVMDNEKLIREVERFPVIYDKGPQDYGEKRKTWTYICGKIFPDWDEWDSVQREKALKDAQKRWTNLRNCFYRSIRKHNQNPRGTRRKYVYADSMQFLLNDLEQPKSPEVEFKVENDDDNYYEPEGLFVEFEPHTSRNPLERTSTDEIDAMNMSEHNSLDQDTNFALSLVPMMKDLPLDLKLQAQIDILKVFQQYTKKDGGKK